MLRFVFLLFFRPHCVTWPPPPSDLATFWTWPPESLYMLLLAPCLWLLSFLLAPSFIHPSCHAPPSARLQPSHHAQSAHGKPCLVTKNQHPPSASPSDDSSADEQTAGPLQPTPAPGTDSDAALKARIRALESQLRAATEPPATGGGTDEPDILEPPPPADRVSRPPKRRSNSHKRRKKSSRPKSRRRSPSSASSSSSPSASSSSSSSSEDSSSDYTSETDSESRSKSRAHKHSTDRPLSSFGTLVGNNISRKIKKKIWNHKFIELNCLLPHVTEEEYNHTMAVASGHDRSLKLVKPKRQTILSIWQWLEAWEVFMAIYTQKSSHRRHIQALLTYSWDIRNMSKLNYDWLGFDREFRMDRESTKCSWATVRHDLHLTYGQPQHPTPRQPTPSFQKPEYTQQQQPFLHHSNVRNHPLYTAQGHAIPRGYCIRFHSREVICEKGTECTYLHKCPTCNRRHPIFDKCHTHRQRLRFNTQNKPSHAESRPDNNHNRPHKKW